jgi:hypothetical protein
LGDKVVSHAPLDNKPLEADLAHPLPRRIRLYMYNATDPPGGRPLGEHKVQIIVPGQGRDERGNFDDSDGRMPVLAGLAPTEEVFIVWDAALYYDFAYSRNVQVKAETIAAALAGRIGRQTRHLQTGTEVVLTATARNLAEALKQRVEIRRQWLLKE